MRVITNAMTAREYGVVIGRDKVSWDPRPGDKYVTIGNYRGGRRFRGEYATFQYANGINMWQGRLYLKRGDALILLKTVTN